MTRPVPRAGQSSTRSDGAEPSAGHSNRLRRPEPLAGFAQVNRRSRRMRGRVPRVAQMPWVSGAGGLRQGVQGAKHFGMVHGGFILTFTLQQLADAALMQVNIEFGGDAVTQIGTAPAHHAIALAVRAVFHPLRHFGQLGFGQTRPARRAGPIREPGQAIRVGTNTLREPFQPAAPAGTFGWLRPVARRLPVPAGAATSRE
jgi:hypothetical protein